MICLSWIYLVVQNVASAIVLDTSSDGTMVQDLLDLKEKSDNIVEKCFGNDHKFVQSLKDAFEDSVNKRQNKPAELIGEWVPTFFFFFFSN